MLPSSSVSKFDERRATRTEGLETEGFSGLPAEMRAMSTRLRAEMRWQFRWLMLWIWSAALVILVAIFSRM